MKSWDLVFDIESNNLLNQETIDYTTVPYKLKDTFKMHCIVADLLVSGKKYIYAFYDGETIILDGRLHVNEVDGETYTLEDYEPQEYIHKQLNEFPLFIQAMPEDSRVVGHNIINFDLLALKLYFGMRYEVEKGSDINEPLGDDTWCGKKVVFDDTMIRSKTLNPDRFGGHSLDVLAQKGSVQKFVFRKHIPKDKRFLHFAADMLYYNIFDTKSNREVAKLLDKEQEAYGWGSKWDRAIKLEKATVELITRQEHRGFKFDIALAEQNLIELDAMMEERRARIEDILPPKLATKTYLKDFIPPATQFLKSGKPNSHITRFVDKHSGVLEERDSGWYAVVLGKEYGLPIPQEPICDKYVPSSVGDTTHIKDWLVGLGWKPLEYKEKDITVDTKKVKLNKERQAAAIERYIAQTLEVSFRQDRCEHLLGIGEITAKSSESYVRNKMLSAFNKRLERGMGVKVLTNPSFTVGQEKEMCPNLLKFAEENKEYACILDIVEYLTYRHRRNSILGGGVSFEDFEEDDEQTAKGFLGNVREDGRIPTPADTCGAATSRFKHRLVANIPRTTSLFGENMRAMFGVDDTCFQVGYDFDSLEARQEAAFCWPYEHGDEKGYCNSLLQDKPFDVHSRMAEKISQIIGIDFGRAPAKSVKYGATYGAQGAKIAKTIGCDVATGNLIFDGFWEAAAPLKKLKDALQIEWGKFDKKRIIGIDGRLVPTRSAHAILNSKFQSGGVICAKLAMVIHDRSLRKEGLLLDFFSDSIGDGDFCQQLVAYHDEAQLEVNKSSVQFKMFKEKKEAEAFKEQQESGYSGKIWSDIKESPKGGWYLAYCRAGELAAEAVKASGRAYGMVIDLTAGYMVERSWAGCH